MLVHPVLWFVGKEHGRRSAAARVLLLPNSDVKVSRCRRDEFREETTEAPPPKSQKSAKMLPVNVINNVDLSLPIGRGLQPRYPIVSGADASAGVPKNLADRRPDIAAKRPVSPNRSAPVPTVDDQGARDTPAPRSSAGELVAVTPRADDPSAHRAATRS